MKTKYIMPILVAVLALSPLACPNPESSGDGGVPAKTGVLTYLDRYSNATNIDGACSVAVSPDGNHVYVTAWTADAVAWFRRD